MMGGPSTTSNLAAVRVSSVVERQAIVSVAATQWLASRSPAVLVAVPGLWSNRARPPSPSLVQRYGEPTGIGSKAIANRHPTRDWVSL